MYYQDTSRSPMRDISLGSTTYCSTLSVSSSPASSPKGMIRVLGYSPKEGEKDVPIAVFLDFESESCDATYLRVVFGQKPVATDVSRLPHTRFGSWKLDATAPSPRTESFSSPVVQMSVEAVNKDDKILDSLTFGEFCYWEPSIPRYRRPSLRYSALPLSQIDRKPVPALSTSSSPGFASICTRKRTSSHSLPTPPPTLPSSPLNTEVPQARKRFFRRTKSQTQERIKSLGKEGAQELHPELDFMTPLEPFCRGWSRFELSAGRRLVRFHKMVQGRRITVYCEQISQEEYCETDVVLSCIYRRELNNFFVTSVDIIYLLEKLCSEVFPVEEKNRIRRNLEGLRPLTLSKQGHGVSDFFQCIMDFPDPKPRNIEKTLKVFEWRQLVQALNKILCKYSFEDIDDDSSSFTSTSTYVFSRQSLDESEDVKPSFETACATEIQPQYPEDDGPYHQQLSEHPTTSSATPRALNRNIFLNPGSSHSSTPLPSPLETPTFTCSQDSMSGSDESWMDIQNITNIDSVHDFTTNMYTDPAYDFQNLDGLAFQTLNVSNPQSEFM